MKRRWNIIPFTHEESRTSQRLTLLMAFSVSLVLQLSLTSHGPDVGTYLDVANKFLQDGFALYRPAQGQSYGFSQAPVHILFLSLLLGVLLSIPWDIVLRIPLILSNLALAFIVYRILGGNKGVIGSLLILFNPFYYLYSIYNGEPDALMLVFVLAALYMFEKKHVKFGALLLGVALMTLQTAVFIILPVLILIYKKYGWQVLIRASLIFAATTMLISIPFVIVSGVRTYLDSLFLRLNVEHAASGYLPNGAFSGIWSFIQFLSSHYGFDPSALYYISPIFLAALMIGLVYLSLRRLQLGFYEAGLMGFIILIIGNTYVNPWHIIPYVPFATLLFLGTKGKSVRFFSLFALLAAQAYRFADNYSAFFSASPPYYAGDLLLFLSLLGLYITLFRQRIVEM